MYIKTCYFKAQWFEVYDLLEFLTEYDARNQQRDFGGTCNAILELEMAGYRIINKQVTPITDEHELREIEMAIENSRKPPLAGVLEHLETALAKLADRKNPDFRNSIKESISAIEAISKKIANKPKADLDEALSVVEKKVPIHGALKKAFLSIYGYTSDSDGIRHSLTEQSNAEFEDAKFMLVSCAAFINYLVVKSQKAGIQL